MKKMPFSILLWVLITVMCVSVISIPISAAGRNSDTLDAVAGSRSGVYQLLGARTSSTYDIYASAGKGGTLFASASSSASGKTIDVFVEPDKGYEMASIFVITAAGDTLKVLVDDGAYSFVMPGEPVVIDVTFQYKRIV